MERWKKDKSTIEGRTMVRRVKEVCMYVCVMPTQSSVLVVSRNKNT